MNYPEPDDKTLVVLIARSDADALSALYDRYSRLVFSLALNAVGDRGAAKESTLDVFTRVWERAGAHQADLAQVSTWLTRIARHRAIDELRRPYRRTNGWKSGTNRGQGVGRQPVGVRKCCGSSSDTRTRKHAVPAVQKSSLTARGS